MKIQVHESAVTKANFIRNIMSRIRHFLSLPNGGACLVSATVSDGNSYETWIAHIGGKKENGKPIVSTKFTCNNTEYPTTFWGQNVPKHILDMSASELNRRNIEYSQAPGFTTRKDMWDAELKNWLESEILKP